MSMYITGSSESANYHVLDSESMDETHPIIIPFTYVGFDVFGQWDIVSRHTRGAVSKLQTMGCDVLMHVFSGN